jgi:glycolate oxidase iron-sulfur subunit
METHLADWIKGTPDGIEAESILRTCVHCGFCNATCPTYQLLGDELDGPRGRIYQIKQMLEGNVPSESTQLHLDRCLTCMNCETTCPSGVRYGRLVDIGRAAVEQRVARPSAQRLYRAFLRFSLTRRWIFDPAVRLGRAAHALLPAALRAKLPPCRAAGEMPRRTHARKILLLNGCVQPALIPAIDAATARVLDALGVGTVVAPQHRCLVAARRKRRRGYRHERVRLRRNGQGLRPPAARRCRLCCEGSARIRTGVRYRRIPHAVRKRARAAHCIGQRSTAAHRVPSAVHAPAHAEAARRD